MKDGFISIAAITPSIRVADCLKNAEHIAEALAKAAASGVQAAVLPELCLTGATCGDLFLHDTLLRGAEEGLRLILEKTRAQPLLFTVGLPVRYGGKLYNCAAVCCSGRLMGLIPKANLPVHGAACEPRWFAPAPEHMGRVMYCGSEVPFGTNQLFCEARHPQFTVAVEIGEDAFALTAPACAHAAAGAQVILNPAAACELVGQSDYRKAMLGAASSRLMAAYARAEAGYGESTTDMVFAGHNLIFECGTLLAESKPFACGFAQSEADVRRLCDERMKMSLFPAGQADEYLTHYFTLPETVTRLTRHISAQPFIPEDGAALYERCESILAIQAAGLARRIEHAWCKKAVIAISGGLDSCLALLAAVRAMDLLGRPHSDILAISMPCFGTTERTRSNAQLLCQYLGVDFDQINISESVRLHLRDIGRDETVQDVTYENAQARERMQVAMDIANREGGLVVGTGDLSELALGWATYNGDHMSMYGVNASIPKTLVRCLVRHCADTCGQPELSRVLHSILDTPVSPELLPAKDGQIAQKTEDIVGPYELHDFFIFHMLRYGFAPGKILRLAEYAFAGVYERETILKWLKIFVRRFFIQQFKRSCIPDGPAVGTVSLSPRSSWRMPSDACAALWQREAEML